MSNFDTDFKQRLKDANDIVSVIGKYITVTRKGKNYWACCPFHHEKTPSFAINDAEQYYHCFGCGEKGDVFTFIQKYENVDFVEAMRILCKNANMEMPERVVDENAKLLKEKRTKVFEANKLAAQHFHSNLKTNAGYLAMKYLNSRQINSNSIVRFGLGYSNGKDALVRFLKEKGVTIETMKDAGLVVAKENYVFDKMNGRLMFPLINAYGDVVGFSGRLLTGEKMAKYINTEQTVVFDKSKVIYGINLIKKQYQQSKINYILLVEGQVDVISLHQAGFPTAVATLGTALTPLHAKELSRYSQNIVVCFDGDGAGKKATLRSLEILKDSFYIKVVTIPNGQDPDDYIKKNGSEAFQQLIDNALPLMDYKIRTLASEYDFNNNYEKSKFTSQAVDMVRELKSSAEQEIYLKLISELTRVSIDNLKRELLTENKKTPDKKEPIELDNKTEESANAYIEACRFILSSLLNKQSYAYFFNDIEFLNPSVQKLYENMKKAKENGQTFIISNVFDLFDVKSEPEINAILEYKINIAEDKAKTYYEACLNILKDLQLETEINKLKNDYENVQDLEIKKEIANKIQTLTIEKLKQSRRR